MLNISRNAEVEKLSIPFSSFYNCTEGSIVDPRISQVLESAEKNYWKTKSQKAKVNSDKSRRAEVERQLS